MISPVPRITIRSAALVALLLACLSAFGCASISYSTSPVAPGAYPAEEGIVSWYGWDFWLRKTADGSRFNPLAMTAAHKTLPLGSVVRVTRLDTNQSVVVTINDRGPFVEGRIIDLTKGAAGKLDLIDKGIAPCRVEVLEVPSG